MTSTREPGRSLVDCLVARAVVSAMNSALALDTRVNVLVHLAGQNRVALERAALHVEAVHRARPSRCAAAALEALHAACDVLRHDGVGDTATPAPLAYPRVRGGDTEGRAGDKRPEVLMLECSPLRDSRAEVLRAPR